MSWFERKGFEQSLRHSALFAPIRAEAYRRAKGDPEKVHEMALEAVNEFEDILERNKGLFDFDNLKVTIGKHHVMPFGTSAGVDKNGDALLPLSHIFGYLEPGTVVCDEREGNLRPRVVADKKNEDIYNAQGFPSKGLKYFADNAVKYREKGGKAPLWISVCGLPLDEKRFPNATMEERLDQANRELQVLVDALSPYADGFVWNPFSPNTAALKALRTPETFEETAEMMKGLGDGKPVLVKMGPFDDTPEAKTTWVDLVDAWMTGGGDGIVAVNTYMVPKEKVPSEEWGYQSAGRSGRFLQPYRQRAIQAFRESYPDSRSHIMLAAGGIDSADQAWDAFTAGANGVSMYSPLTYHGFGLVRDIAKGLDMHLAEAGFMKLAHYQEARRRELWTTK